MPRAPAARYDESPMSLTIAVCLKRNHDTTVGLRLDQAGRGIRAEEAPASRNPADLAALACALALRAHMPGARVLALAVGPREWEEPLRGALAAGADEALRLWNASWPLARFTGEVDGSASHTRFVAEAAAEVLRGRVAPLVLAGEASLDGTHGCFGAFLAYALGAAYAHRAVSIELVTGVAPQAAPWRVRVKLDRGFTQEMELISPAVVTVSASAATRSEAGLPAWMASRAARIPLQAPGLSYPAAPPTLLRAPVPRVKRYSVPDPALDAESRIRVMVEQPLSGGGARIDAEQGTQAQADAVLAMLAERGFWKER